MKMMMKIFKRGKMIAFICLIMLSLNNITQAATHQSDFVLLIYMNGSNLESEYKFATHNIKDMLWEDSADIADEHLTILLLMGGTKKWHLGEIFPEQSIANDSITYATITRNGFQKIRSCENRSIGDPSTLTEFINYGIKEFPADNYGLIFWNHGSGSVIGFGYDELHDDTSLSLSEIREGLEGASLSEKFSFIGFDACLMATLETAETVSPYANYLVASQELEPGKGWDYRSITHSLRQMPHLSGEQIGRIIADSFVDRYEMNDYEEVTLSVIDLNKVSSLADCVGTLSATIHDQFINEPDTIYKRLSESISKSKSFGIPALTYDGQDMVDLLDFCQHIGNKEAPSLLPSIQKGVKEAVVYSRQSKSLKEDSICGLSVYFPLYNLNIASDLSAYQQCNIPPAYLDLVNGFAQRLLKGSLSEKVDTIVKNDSLVLSTEMLLKLRKVYATLLAFDGTQWVTYGLDGDGVSLDNDGRIIRKDSIGEIMKGWDKKWIKLGGKPISAYMGFADENSLTYTIPVFLNGDAADLILTYNENNPKGKIYGARKIIGDNIPDKGITEIRANDTITILHERFDETHEREYIPSDTIIVKKKKDMKIRTDQMPKGKYRYGYCLIDLYGRRYYTPFTDYELQ